MLMPKTNGRALASFPVGVLLAVHMIRQAGAVFPAGQANRQCQGFRSSSFQTVTYLRSDNIGQPANHIRHGKLADAVPDLPLPNDSTLTPAVSANLRPKPAHKCLHMAQARHLVFV